VVTFIPRCCPATIRGYKCRDMDRYEELMKYAVEKGSGAIMYIPNLMKIG
jgi:hypothetical protein